MHESSFRKEIKSNRYFVQCTAVTNDVLCWLVTLDPRIDLGFQLVKDIVGVFGPNHAGTSAQRDSMVDQWLATSRREAGNRMIKAVYNWIQQTRNEAIVDRNRATDPRTVEMMKLQEQVAHWKQQATKKGHEGRRQENSRTRSPDPPQKVRFDCRYCLGPHKVMDCPDVVACRVANAPLPIDMCPYCLGRTADGHHLPDDQKGCHIRAASNRQKKAHGNEHLKRDELCLTTNMSVYACNHCYIGTADGLSLIHI